MKIAIVGTGVSGLAAAHHLARDHELTLFEAADRVGGHVHTHRVEQDGHVVLPTTLSIAKTLNRHLRFTDRTTNKLHRRL